MRSSADSGWFQYLEFCPDGLSLYVFLLNKLFCSSTISTNFFCYRWFKRFCFKAY